MGNFFSKDLPVTAEIYGGHEGTKIPGHTLERKLTHNKKADSDFDYPKIGYMVVDLNGRVVQLTEYQTKYQRYHIEHELGGIVGMAWISWRCQGDRLKKVLSQVVNEWRGWLESQQPVILGEGETRFAAGWPITVTIERWGEGEPEGGGTHVTADR